MNFSYVHSAIEKNIGKIISIVSLEGITKGKNEELGNKLAMHIAASSPLAINSDDIDKDIVNKELEIIKAEIVNSGKASEMVEEGKEMQKQLDLTNIEVEFMLPFWIVAKNASNPILMCGQGADELFGGYCLLYTSDAADE